MGSTEVLPPSTEATLTRTCISLLAIIALSLPHAALSALPVPTIPEERISKETPASVKDAVTRLYTGNLTTRLPHSMSLRSEGFFASATAVPFLISLLPATRSSWRSSSSDTEEAAWAVALLTTLAAIGELGHGPLLTALQDPRAPVREGAAFSLSRMHALLPTAPLLLALHDTDPLVQESVITRPIPEGGRVITDAVYAMTASPNLSVRSTWQPSPLPGATRPAGIRPSSFGSSPVSGQRFALVPRLNALGDTHERRAVPALVELLKGPDDVLAAASLGRIGDPAAVPALLAALHGRGGDSAAAAAEALGDSGDRRGVPYLIAALGGSYVPLSSEAAEALGKLHDTPGLGPLLRSYRSPKSAFRQTALTALAVPATHAARTAIARRATRKPGRISGPRHSGSAQAMIRGLSAHFSGLAGFFRRGALQRGLPR